MRKIEALRYGEAQVCFFGGKMRNQFLGAVGAVLLCASASSAMAEVVKGPIGDVVSEPITTTGDAKQIAKRGETCMAQILKPGEIGAQTIIASDIDAGRIVGRNAFSFTDYFMFPTSYDGRTRVVFEAKDGRFRISHTQTEIFDKLIKEWIPANNLSKKRNGYLEMTTSITEELSKCVVAAGNSNW